ncbi:MAG: SDR family oxidoreductase [Pisciglobus halotolerans]|nr:SDR family oxidoreductase [Pisciglobus halotolerans]
MLLKDKVVIVTGAASGFGRDTSLLFAEEGAKVIAVDFNKEGVNETVEQIKTAGREATSIQADVSSDEDVHNFMKKAVQTYGKIDILFNNAGIYVPGKADEVSEDDWDKMMNVNLKSVYLGSKHAVPYMKENGSGVIINTASAAGIIGFPNAVAYAASKGGVVSLTKAMAVDYASENIRVNCICPGTGETGLTKEVLENEQLREMFLAPIPMGRFAQPQDIAKAALFLASDLSAYLTGVALPVDGGWTVQ